MKLLFKNADPLAVIERREFATERVPGRTQFWCTNCKWSVDDYGDAAADASGRAADHVADSGHKVSGTMSFSIFIQKRLNP